MSDSVSAPPQPDPKMRRLGFVVLGSAGFCAFCFLCGVFVSAMQYPGPTTTDTPTPTSTPTTNIAATASFNLTATKLAEPTETETPTSEPSSTLTPRPTLTIEPSATALILDVAPPASSTGFDRNGDGSVTCADFSTQSQAKQALNAGYDNLDRDGDGEPCESLP